MATSWPEAIPLRSVMARAVADAVIDMFGRIGLPFRLLQTMVSSLQVSS